MIECIQPSNVGPGSYTIKNSFEGIKNKGGVWSKNAEKRFENKDYNVDKNINVGPGVYEGGGST